MQPKQLIVKWFGIVYFNPLKAYLFVHSHLDPKFWMMMSFCCSRASWTHLPNWQILSDLKEILHHGWPTGSFGMWNSRVGDKDMTSSKPFIPPRPHFTALQSWQRIFRWLSCWPFPTHVGFRERRAEQNSRNLCSSWISCSLVYQGLQSCRA